MITSSFSIFERMVLYYNLVENVFASGLKVDNRTTVTVPRRYKTADNFKHCS